MGWGGVGCLFFLVGHGVVWLWYGFGRRFWDGARFGFGSTWFGGGWGRRFVFVDDGVVCFGLGWAGGTA